MYPASKFIVTASKTADPPSPSGPVTVSFENGKLCLQGVVFEIDDPDCQSDIRRGFDSRTTLTPQLVRMRCIILRGYNSTLDAQTLVGLPGYISHLRPFTRSGVVSLVGEITFPHPASKTWDTSDFPKTVPAKVLATITIMNDPMRSSFPRGRFDRAFCHILTPITGISRNDS